MSRSNRFPVAGAALLIYSTLVLVLSAKPVPMPVWYEPAAGGIYVSRQGPVQLALRPDRLCWTFGGQNPVEVRFSGTAWGRQTRLQGEQPMAARAQYLTAARMEKNVPLYERARYRDLYPGVDLVFHGAQSRPEFDFELAAGVDAAQVQLDLRGHRGLAIEADGSLTIDSKGGQIHWHRPVVIQDGRRVEGKFRLLGRNGVGFVLGPHDPARPVVIDPVLSYSTYFGAAGNDAAMSVATDAMGNAYVFGLTTSQELRVSRNAAQPAYGGQASGLNGGDTFVAKFSPAGALLFVTYLGGSGDDAPGGIAVDLSGNVYLAGMTTSRNFPVTANAPQRTYAGAGAGQLFPAGDAFVAKLSVDGSQIVYATYLGGASDDEANAIAVDAQGNAYVAGSTASSAFPTTENAFQKTYKGNIGQPTLPRFGTPFLRRGDIFLVKINPGGTQLTYSTLLGGQREEAPRSLAIDAQGNAYVAGYTLSTDFPVTAAAYQRESRRSDLWNEFFNLGDGFVTKVNPSGSGLVYSTYLGGSGDDLINALTIDSAGNAYLAGPTSSTNFPVTAGAFSTRNRGPVDGAFESFDDDQLWGDAFVAKLSADGTRLLQATYFGGSGDDIPTGIALDQSGNIIIGGMTLSPNLPVTADAAQGQIGGRARPFVGQSIGDGFVAQFNAELTGVIYVTYLGGTLDDAIGGLALDRSGNLWVAGTTGSLNLPTRGNSTQANFGGSSASQFFRGDAFLARLEGFAQPVGPTLSIRSIANAASYSARIAPGMLFVAFTTAAGPKELVGAALTPSGLYDTVRSETRFLFDGVAAPLIYVREDQSSGIVPYAVAGKASVQVVVEYKGQRSAPITLPVSPAAPGLFSVNQAGSGPGAIYNQDGTPNAPANPAAKGSIVVLYGTGEGQTSPAGVDGKIASAEFPRPNQTVVATVAGRDASILYAGAIPGQVAGLFQVNIQLPQDLASGNQPVLLTVGGIASQANLTVAVQ